MSDPTEDLDALFEEMAAQHRSDTSPAATSSPAAHVEEPVTVDTVAEVVSTPARPAFDASAERPAMYESVGHIVRQLHDSLRELGYDRSLSDISSEVTDAASRLEYIASLTEQAANKVLNSIDEAMPAPVPGWRSPTTRCARLPHHLSRIETGMLFSTGAMSRSSRTTRGPPRPCCVQWAT